MKLKEGDIAPEFSLPDQNGAIRSLREFKGKWVVLYFYPRDNTPGCTKEACAFRDSFEQLRSMGAEVIGISTDSEESHQRFAVKFSLPFILLADKEKIAHTAYESFGEKLFMGKTVRGTLRQTFLIDPAGVIRKIYLKVKPESHAGEVAADLSRLMS
jgi:thioredoxin-dependent peroxiredoxin